MSGYQFAHLDSYARKASSKVAGGKSAQDIADEAERKEGAYKHLDVEQVADPIIRYGMTPSEVVKAATEWAEQAKDPKGKKLRIDGQCMAAGVFSVPEDFPEDRWAEYRDAMIEHLKGTHGERLRSVVEHVDEPITTATFTWCRFLVRVTEWCILAGPQRKRLMHGGSARVYRPKPTARP